MMKRQRGMTLIGWAITLAVVGVFVLAFLRLTPVYLEYMKITGALESVKAEYDGQNPTLTELRSGLAKRWSIEDIRSIKPQDVTIRKDGAIYWMIADYDRKAQFIANVSFLVEFKKEVEVRR